MERVEQLTSPGVIEDPGVDKRAGNRDEEEARVVGEAERSEYLRKERGQMPQAMQRAEDDGPQDRAVALLQPRQRKAAPAQFFGERRRQNDEHRLWQEHGQQKWRLRQERQGQVHSQKDAVAQQEDQEKAENGDQVPVDADPPVHTTTEQLSHTRSARDDGGHGEGCQGRPGKGCEDKRDIKRAIWKLIGKEAKPT